MYWTYFDFLVPEGLFVRLHNLASALHIDFWEDVERVQGQLTLNVEGPASTLTAQSGLHWSALCLRPIPSALENGFSHCSPAVNCVTDSCNIHLGSCWAVQALVPSCHFGVVVPFRITPCIVMFVLASLTSHTCRWTLPLFPLLPHPVSLSAGLPMPQSAPLLARFPEIGETSCQWQTRHC